MTLGDELNSIIADDIKRNQSANTQVIAGLASSSTTSGMGVVTQIVESETEGKYLKITMDDGDEIVAYPGFNPVLVNERVSICGGRVFN